jgi:hypothetical protein
MSWMALAGGRSSAFMLASADTHIQPHNRTDLPGRENQWLNEGTLC